LDDVVHDVAISNGVMVLIVEAMNDDAIQMFAMVIVKSFDLWSSWCESIAFILFCGGGSNDVTWCSTIYNITQAMLHSLLMHITSTQSMCVFLDLKFGRFSLILWVT